MDSYWKPAGLTGYEPKTAEERDRIAQILEMVRDFAEIEDPGDRRAYVAGVEQSMAGRASDFARAICTLPKGETLKGPFIALLEALEERQEPIYRTDQGRFRESFLHEHHARRVGNVIQFPIAITWDREPDEDRGIPGIPRDIVYPQRPAEPPKPEQTRAPWEYGQEVY